MKQGHSEFPVTELAGAEVTGGAGTRRGLAEPASVAPDGTAQLPCLPIDVFTVFDGEYIQQFRADTAVENTIGPDSAGPDLVFLKVTFQRFTVERMIGEVTERFFHSFSRGVATILEVFERLRCETDLPPCSSPNTSLKE